MHNYTRLQLDELKIRYNKEREKEWASIDSNALNIGMFGSSGHILQFLENGHKYIDKLIDELFKTETISLSHEQEKPTETYFVDLNREMIEIAKGEYEVIRSEALKMFDNWGGGQLAHNDDMNIQQDEISTCESINRKIKMLQEELRLRIPQSSTETTIHVSGDVGVINAGTIYGSIQVKIEKLKESNQTELVNMLTLLTETINNSTIKDENKREQMENVDFLVEQCEMPSEKKKSGSYKSN
ncbi:MAG: hypothetical protein HYV59_11115 [Planctomycetes bacterium]|nr:hypothetical protein [Planctomycetota bacterium]